MRIILRYLKDYIPHIILIVALLIVQAYCNLTIPAYTSDIVNVGVMEAGTGGDMSSLYSIALRMIIMTIIMMIAAILAGYVSSYVAAKNSQKLREQLFGKVLAFSNTEVERFSTASLITRCTNDIQQIQMSMVMLLRIVLFAPIIAIGGIIRVVGYGTGMYWIIILAAIIMTAVIITLMGIAMPKFRILQTKIDKVNLISREDLDGIPVVRAFGRERHEEKRFDVANEDLTKTQLFVNRVMTVMMPVMMMVMNGVNILILWFGAHQIEVGSITVGDISAFMTYALEIIMAFMMIEMMAVMLPRAIVSAQRIDKVMKTDFVINNAENCAQYDDMACTGRVEFDHVTFTYPGADHPAVEDIDFVAEPGKTTAIIGSTGCGKTTLVNLILRFYDVTEGSIRLDGVDIRDISQKKLRAEIGLVPQKGYLFSGTIESNIKYSGESVTDEVMEEAASIAQATEFIEKKDQGYQDPISQGGTNVSGGQKQRLCIARALAKQAPVLIFDDSFSALDFKTDTAVRRELRKKSGDSAVIIVAQRISTVLHADQIIVLNDGVVSGIGTHSELMKSCQTYQEIARSQLSDKELELNGGGVNA